MRAKITKTEVDKAKKGPNDIYIWDTLDTGFGLKVTPKGKKVFIVQYRLGGRSGRTRRVTLGNYGPNNGKAITPEQARKKAKKIIGQVANGNDPAEEKTIERKKGKFIDHLNTYFETEVVPSLKPTTVDAYERVIRLYIPQRLRTRKTANIEKQDIRTLRNAMKTNPYGANKTIAFLSAFFNSVSYTHLTLPTKA